MELGEVPALFNWKGGELFGKRKVSGMDRAGRLAKNRGMGERWSDRRTDSPQYGNTKGNFD